MSQEHPTWKTGNFTGPNDKLLSIATKMVELTKLAMNAKLVELKAEIKRESLNFPPEIRERYVAEIEKLEIR